MFSNSKAIKIRTGYVVIAMAGCILCGGCEKEQPPSSADLESKSNAESESYPQDDRQLLHDEQEELAPGESHGINGGQTFVFEPADFVGEWLVSKDSVTRIFLLDATGKSNAAVKIDDLVVQRGDTVFTLDPEDADSDGKTAVYVLEDQDLSIAMNLGVEVVLQIGEQSYRGKIKPVGNEGR